MPSIRDAIAARKSVRTFTGEELTEADRAAVGALVAGTRSCPFGHAPRFSVIDSEIARQKGVRLGTYGTIKGAGSFIAGVVSTGPGANEDFGYALEWIILDASVRGLGTCWLAGSLTREEFAEAVGMRDGEMLPAVTPVGYRSRTSSARDSVTRLVVRASDRKPWGALFFDGDTAKPLAPDASGLYREVLEGVRLAPSASNKQPWRLVRDGYYHFYLDEDKAYNRSRGEIRVQNVDMGIAMCHFERVARELALEGAWKKIAPAPAAGSYTYIVSWVPA